MDDREEQQIIRLLSDAATQRKGFELLVRSYSEQLYWTIRRFVLIHDDANDVLQNTLLKAWNGLDSFHGDAKISTWLSRIAINESLDFLRRRKQQTVSMEDVSIGLLADDYFDGSVFCFAPGQVVQINLNDDEVPNSICLLFHPDLIRGTELGKKMVTRYPYFSYGINGYLTSIGDVGISL